MRELGETDHVSISVLHEDELPVARLRIHAHLVHDAPVSVELLHIHLKRQDLLLIVPHESQLNREALSASVCRWQSDSVWLLRVRATGRREDLLRVRCFLSSQAGDLHLLEEMEWQSSFIDTAELDLRTVFNQRNFEALLHLPSWDLIAEFLH